MGRKVLSLLLIATTLLGQSSVCCCTFGTVSSALKHEASTDSCCCQTAEDSTQECPDSSKAPGHQCPCKKGKLASANLASDEFVPTLTQHGSTGHFDSVPQLGRPLLVEMAQLKSTYFRSTAFPHLDRTGILRAVNSLRC